MTSGLCFEVRWKLKEKQAKLARLADWFKRSDKLGYIAFAIAQPLEVRVALQRFEAEPEVCRESRQANIEHLRSRQSAEGVINLN